MPKNELPSGRRKRLDLAGNAVGREGVTGDVDRAQGEVIVRGDVTGLRSVDPTLFEGDRAALDGAFEDDLGAVTAEAAGDDMDHDATDHGAVVVHPLVCERGSGTVDRKVDHPAVVPRLEMRFVRAPIEASNSNFAVMTTSWIRLSELQGRIFPAHFSVVRPGGSVGVVHGSKLDQDAVRGGRVTDEERVTDRVIFPLREFPECG